MKSSLLALLCFASLSACAQPSSSSAVSSTTASSTAASSTASSSVAPVSTTGQTAPAIAAAAQQVAPAVTSAKVDDRVRAAILSIAPNAKIDRIAAAPLPGFREVILGGQVLYVSDDGKYLIQGSLFDVKAKKDLSQIGMSVVRREALKKVPPSDRIIFAPLNPKHRVAIFTDIECGFCRKLHQDIAQYNRLGIAIEYLAFPRAGKASADFKAMEAVWCAADRRKALTDAKAGRPAPVKRCTNPVMMQYDLGQRIGLAGTPMIINEDGIALPGYMEPGPMLEMLNKLAAERKPKSGAAAGGR